MSRALQSVRVHLRHQPPQDVRVALQEAPQPTLERLGDVADLGAPDRDTPFRSAQLPLLVPIPIASMRLGRLGALIVPALKMVGHFLLQQFLHHALSPQADERTGHVSLACLPLGEQRRNRFSEVLARWYSGHGLGSPSALAGGGLCWSHQPP